MAGLIWLAILGATLRGVVRDKWTDPDFIAVVAWLLLFSLLAIHRPTRLLACIATVTLVVPFYMLEIYLHMGSSRAASTHELRARGIEAYPLVSPNELMELWRSSGDENPIRVGDREVLPLAGIPDSPTVYCQADNGGMVVYRSDSLGFRNPEPISSAGPPQFALLGDSFVHGYCVRDEDTYAAHIATLGSTNSFGIDGTSVLAQLAIFTEYVQRLEVRHLIWFFYAGNDLSGFVAERKRPPLRAYLNPGHSQDLVTLNDPVATATKRYIDEQLMRRAGAARFDVQKPWDNVLWDFLFLRKTRDALLGANVRKFGQVSQDELPPSISQARWREITGIWRRVTEQQRETGGDLTFVYIPSVNRFAADDGTVDIELEDKIRAIWRDLDVDHLSFTDLLLTLDNPISLYSGIHFTREGYEVTAEYLISHLDRLRRAAAQSGRHPGRASAMRSSGLRNPRDVARCGRSRTLAVVGAYPGGNVPRDAHLWRAARTGAQTQSIASAPDTRRRGNSWRFTHAG